MTEWRGERGGGGWERGREEGGWYTTIYTLRFARRRFVRLFKYIGWEGLNFSSISAFQAAGKENKGIRRHLCMVRNRRLHAEVPEFKIFWIQNIWIQKCSDSKCST
jgi:hypothetical protein